MKKHTTAERLKTIMQERDLKQADILRLAEPYCVKYGIPLRKNDLSQYVNGKNEPGQFKLTILAQALDVSEAWLMGYDVSSKHGVHSINEPLTNNEFTLLSMYRTLNKEGQEKSVEYITDLAGNAKYTQKIYKIAARNGQFVERPLSDSEVESLMNCPDVDDL